MNGMEQVQESLVFGEKMLNAHHSGISPGTANVDHSHEGL
jgi:hypothetical protein